MFGRQDSTSGKTGRAAKPGESVDNRGLPVRQPSGTPAKSTPRTTGRRPEGR